MDTAMAAGVSSFEIRMGEEADCWVEVREKLENFVERPGVAYRGEGGVTGVRCPSRKVCPRYCTSTYDPCPHDPLMLR